MEMTAEELLKEREGSLCLDAQDEATTLEISGRGEVRSYQLTDPSLPKLESSAKALEGFRPTGKTSDDFLRILEAFMPPEEAKRLVQVESVSTVIRTMRGLVARAHGSIEAVSAGTDDA